MGRDINTPLDRPFYWWTIPLWHMLMPVMNCRFAAICCETKTPKWRSGWRILVRSEHFAVTFTSYVPYVFCINQSLLLLMMYTFYSQQSISRANTPSRCVTLNNRKHSLFICSRWNSGSLARQRGGVRQMIGRGRGCNISTIVLMTWERLVLGVWQKKPSNFETNMLIVEL